MAVRFPFGHGLSYTNFSYRDLRMIPEAGESQDHVTITCSIKNSGKVAGKEVVQLYVLPAACEVRRPVRELKGFQKVELKPGEERTVSFRLDRRSFAYYEEQISDWFVPGGTYGIEIGSSSRNIRLSGSYEIHAAEELPVYFSETSTIGEVLGLEKGKQFMAQVIGMPVDEKEEEGEHLGKGAARVKEAMMRDMPLQALVTYGRITGMQLKDFLENLNS